ncbi:MAG: hypothetical protein AB1576_11065 [Bacillota bacterium]
MMPIGALAEGLGATMTWDSVARVARTVMP